MPSNPEQFADMVVMTVKNALAPVLERLALSEQSNKELREKVAELTQMRDRVTAVEVKAAMPAPLVDFAPVLERLAQSEQSNRDLQARVAELSSFRDRVIAIETKGATPSSPVDLSPMLDGLKALEGRMGELLTKSTPVTSALESRDDLGPLEQRVQAIEVKLEVQAPALATIAEFQKDFGALRERVATVEARQPIPGPQGPAGANGKDGVSGRDGVDGKDGLGFDDLAISQPDERTIAVKAIRGDRVKELGTVMFPVEIYRGVYVEGKAYERGDCVTWGGSEFHCNEATTTKPEQSKAWTLKVKRGRDGKDGINGKDFVPVVSVK